MELAGKLYDFIMLMIESIGIYGPLLGCALIVIESIIPILPLSFFITINFLAFGNAMGFLISWIFTCIGCIASFIIFRKGGQKWFTNKVRTNEFVNRFMVILDGIKFKHLVVLIAIPFTPAFAVNIAAGLSKMSTKKFLIALLIGKVFMVYFCGFIGTSLIQSLTEPIVLLKVILATAIAYIIGKYLSEKID